MDFRVIGQALGLFAVTNIDDLVVLALLFSQATTRRSVLRVVAGQYVGFAAILTASILGALGADLLPASVVPYLGLLPLTLGVRAGWRLWRGRRSGIGSEGVHEADGQDGQPDAGASPFYVAAITLANGGDNVGVYVPVFATTGTGELLTYVLIFLIGVAVWCAAGHFFATRPVVARALAAWGDILLPIVLIAIGLAILIEGHAFDL